MKTSSKKDSAVSPVIGTILLVAITVVLVAIISAVVMGMTGDVGTTYTVGVQVSSNASQTILVTLTGGADYSKLKDIKVIYNGTQMPSYSTTTNSINKDLYNPVTKPAIGVPAAFGNPTRTLLTSAYGATAEVTVVGNFTDGKTQTIYTGSLLVPKTP